MEDLFLLENLLTEDERLIRDNVAQVLAREIQPDLLRAFEAADFPKTWIQGLAKLGLLGITVPEIYGGLGANAVQYGLVCQELERCDSALRSFVSVHNSLCAFPILSYGTDKQKSEFLPKLVKGEWIACFALTEPDAGSDPESMKTIAKKEKGGWRLNGAKMWITNAPIADLAIVWAKTSEGIRGFLVEREFEGFSSRAAHHKVPMRASLTGELIFQDCWIPESHYLPGTEKGLSTALRCLTEARYGIAWGVMGAAENCFDVARDYCLARKQFGKPIASFQLVQKSLTDMMVEILKARTLNLQLGRLKMQGKASFVAISLAKLNACREALKIAREARNLLGANGITLKYPIIRHMNNLEAVSTYEGTDNIHHLIVGKHITGLSAYR